MILHINLFLISTLVLISSVKCDHSDLESEEETGLDDALRQALVLVELLRSEYVRVLRENKILSAAIAIVGRSTTEHTLPNTTLAVNLDADTAQADSPSSSQQVIITSSSTRSLPRVPPTSDLAHHYLNRFGRENPLRRFMAPPHEINPSRRFMVPPTKDNREKVFKNRESWSRKVTTAPASTKTEDTNKYETKKSSTKNVTKSKSRKSKKHNNVTTVLGASKTEATNKLKTEKSSSKRVTKPKSRKSKNNSNADHKIEKLTTKKVSKDPYVALIASEIMNELQEGSPENLQLIRSEIQGTLAKISTKKQVQRRNYKTASNMLSNLLESNPGNLQILRRHIQDALEKKSTKNDQIYKPTLETLSKKNTKKEIKYKTTLKIHLGKSTRMPLPLPENNAFCFYVPESPLCGSSKRK